jgi:RNA polymerase subunit RPABC4/transcription elongation factor Spt4
MYEHTGGGWYYYIPRQGWLCPRCNIIINPDVQTCPNCKELNNKTYWGGTITVTTSGIDNWQILYHP